MIPTITETVVDGGLGLLPDPTDNVHVAIGSCSAGAENTVGAYADIQTMRTALGDGPLVEKVADALTTVVNGVAPRPVLAMRIHASVAGSCGATTTTRVASSVGTVTPSGAPVDRYDVIVKVTRTGAPGTGAFQLSLDGGDTFGPETAVPGGGTATTNGFTLTFAGSLDAGDTVAFACAAPSYTLTDLAAAFTALLADPSGWSFIHILGAPAPVQTAVVSAGTSPPVVSLTGTPAGYYDLRIEITTGGARGTAVFRWSVDAGATWTSLVTTAATCALGSTGLTAVFATGTNYSTDNVYTSHGGAGLAALVAAVDTQLAAAFTAQRPAFAIVEAPECLDSILTQTAAAMSSVRTMAAASAVECASAISGRIFHRPAAWKVAHRLAATPVHEDPARYASGPLGGVVSLYRDERVTPGLDAARYATLRTFVAVAQVFYVGNGRMLAPAGSDYALVMNRRVMDKACAVTYLAMLRFSSDTLRVNPSTSRVPAGQPGAPGTIDERDAQGVEAWCQGKLDAAMGGNYSSGAVQVNRVDNLLSTNNLRLSIRIVPFAYAKAITVELSFKNPALGN